MHLVIWLKLEAGVNSGPCLTAVTTESEMTTETASASAPNRPSAAQTSGPGGQYEKLLSTVGNLQGDLQRTVGVCQVRLTIIFSRSCQLFVGSNLRLQVARTLCDWCENFKGPPSISINNGILTVRSILLIFLLSLQQYPLLSTPENTA